MITILMDQNAIEEALTNYTESDLGVDLSEKEVSIKLIAGRGENGLRAEVMVVPRDEVTTESSDPEPDVEDVEPEVETEEAAVPSGPFD